MSNNLHYRVLCHGMHYSFPSYVYSNFTQRRSQNILTSQRLRKDNGIVWRDQAFPQCQCLLNGKDSESVCTITFLKKLETRLKENFVIQPLSHVQFYVTSWTEASQAPLSITNSQSLLKCMSFESVISWNHLTLHRPILLLPSIFPSIRVFSNESVNGTRWLKYWSFNFSISASNEYSGLISFSIDLLHLLADQGTLKSLLQHHRSKASIIQH